MILRRQNAVAHRFLKGCQFGGLAATISKALRSVFHAVIVPLGNESVLIYVNDPSPKSIVPMCEVC